MAFTFEHDVGKSDAALVRILPCIRIGQGGLAQPCDIFVGRTDDRVGGEQGAKIVIARMRDAENFGRTGKAGGAAGNIILLAGEKPFGGRAVDRHMFGAFFHSSNLPFRQSFGYPFLT